MQRLKTICVYCGTHDGTDSAHTAGARVLGRALAESRLTLVYGGASIGVMGALARAVLDNGGSVTGVIPDFLTEREGTFGDVTELVITKSMHERKQLMFDRSDGFVALPGGIGTLEELVEMMTWLQLGQHAKPIVLGNFSCFWNPLIELLDHMREQGFISLTSPVRYAVAERAEDIVPLLFNGVAGARHADRSGSGA